MKKIGVLIKEPGKKPRHVNISDSLANLQNTVGGYIETVTLANDCVVICNDEGRINGMDYNCTSPEWISSERSSCAVWTVRSSPICRFRGTR